MKVLCYNSVNVNNVDATKFQPHDVIVFGLDGLNKIRYKNELNGTESVLQNFATLSKKHKKIIISGAITDNYGIIRKSAVVADNGKLLGISDMNLNVNSSGYSQGGGYRVYQTTKARIGIIIGDDVIDSDGVKAMSLCDADFIIVIENEEKPQYELLIRAYSYLFGVPILLLANGNVIASDVSGEICGGSREKTSEIILPTKKTYRVVQNKRRGVF